MIGWIDQQSNQTPVLYGVENISITQESVFDPKAGVTAIDRAGRDLTEFIVFEGTVDTSIPKSHKMIYRVLDSYKTIGVAERIVTVIPINK
ncbi:TPA: immunoglobulin-like domain-containing protein [Bacillus cereus]